MHSCRGCRKTVCALWDIRLTGVAILIDQPEWHAHGTRWSHLVSDSSLAELHAFAASAGLPARSFDLDHYDTPIERYDDLVAAGALPVHRRELVRRLSGSGLRVAGRDRPATRRRALAARWAMLAPGDDHIGEALLARWHEPHRVYHGPEHLNHALDSLDVVSGTRPARRVEQFAVWFHDAVYTVDVDPHHSELLGGHSGAPVRVTASNEEASADLARTLLEPVRSNLGLSPAEITEVSRLVMVTAEHNPRTADAAGARVSDADLAILGSSRETYTKYVGRVRREYAHVRDADFHAARGVVLAGLLARGPIFRTAIARDRWEDHAQANLRSESG